MKEVMEMRCVCEESQSSNHQFTPKTVEEIWSNEGREGGSDCKQAATSWMEGCGQSEFSLGRCPWFMIEVRNSLALSIDSSE